MRDRTLLVILLIGLLAVSLSACEEPDEIPGSENLSAAVSEPAATPSPSQPAVLNPQPVTPAPVPEPTPAPVAVPEPAPAVTPAPAPVAVPATPAPSVTPLVTPKPTASTEAPISPTPTEKTFVAEMPERLQELLALPEKKVKSYEFVYAPPPDNLARDHYFIKGDKFRVSLYQLNVFRIDEYYDTVFVDTTKKTAIGYCEGVRAGRCFNTTKPYDLRYADWIKVKTPYQWLKEIPYGEIQGSEKIYDRQSVKVYFEKDNKKWWFWLDEYSGLPIRIIEEKDGEETKYEFRYLALNTVTDDFVVHVD